MQIAVVNANKSEPDILRDELKTFRAENAKQFRIEHVLSHPREERKGRKAHVDAEWIKAVGSELGEGTVPLRCGSLEMTQKATLQSLGECGDVENQDCFALGF